MKIETDNRGFPFLIHDTYYGEPKKARLVGASSAIGEYEHSLRIPGSSFLWVGDHHHLNREEVQQLVGYLQHWLLTKRLTNDEHNTLNNRRANLMLVPKGRSKNV